MAATVVPMGLAGLYLLRGAERQIILLFRLIGYIYYRQTCIYVFIIVNSKASYMYVRTSFATLIFLHVAKNPLSKHHYFEKKGRASIE
jgi:hypothetical protein